MRWVNQSLGFLIVYGVVLACSQSNGKKGRSQRSSPATLQALQEKDENAESVDSDFDDSQQLDSILSLSSYDPQPFDKVYPQVKDRFFINGTNDVYFDFKHEDGSWDLDTKGKGFESQAAILNFDYKNSKIPNLLFPQKLGIIQFQPARLSNGAVVVFFIDKDKNLKAIKQTQANSDQWSDVALAYEIDSYIEMILTVVNEENKIQILCVKKVGNDSVVLTRTLTNEDAMLFSAPDIEDSFTSIDQLPDLLKRVEADMKKQGLMIVTVKDSDTEIAKAIIAGNNERAGVSQEASDEAGANLVGVGSAYEDNAAAKAWTGKGSYGRSIVSKGGWDSPNDICSNLATAVVLSTCVASGPVGGVLMLGGYSSLDNPEHMQKVAKQQAAMPLKLEDYMDLRLYEAFGDGIADDDRVVPIPSIEPADELTVLSETDLANISSDCNDLYDQLDKNAEGYKLTTSENMASQLCMQFLYLQVITASGDDFKDKQKQDEGSDFDVSLEIFVPDLSGFAMTTASYAQWGAARVGEGAVAGLSLLSQGIGITFKTGLGAGSWAASAMFQQFKMFGETLGKYRISYKSGSLSVYRERSKNPFDYENLTIKERWQNLTKSISDKVAKLTMKTPTLREALSSAAQTLKGKIAPKLGSLLKTGVLSVGALVKKVAVRFAELPAKIASSLIESILSAPGYFVATTRANWSAAAAGQQAKLGATAVVFGGLSSYSEEDATAKSSSEAGANVIVESPLAAAEGLERIHSTAGSLCRGDLATVVKNATHMAASIAGGLLDVAVGATKLLCEGAKALDETEAIGAGAQYKEEAAKGTKQTLCTVATGTRIAAKYGHKAIDATEKSVGKAAEKTQKAVKKKKTWWLVEPDAATSAP